VIEQPKELRFPVDCDTPAKRTEYCYRVQELLRQRHNQEWEDGGYKTAIATLNAEYEKDSKTIAAEDIPARQEKLQADIEIAVASFRQWQQDWHEEEKEGVVTAALLENRALLKQSTAWDIDIEAI